MSMKEDAAVNVVGTASFTLAHHAWRQGKEYLRCGTYKTSHRAERVCIGLRKSESRSTAVAQRTTGHMCRIGSEAVVVADVAPEAVLKDLQAAVLIAGASTPIDEASGTIQFCMQYVTVQ